MGRRPHNKLPTAHALLTSMAHDLVKVKDLLDETKDTQKFYYDTKRAAKPCIALQPGDEVRMAPYPGSHKWMPGVVVQPHCAPRSYIVDSGGRKFRRNSQHLHASTAAANQSRLVMCDDHWRETPGPHAAKEPQPPPAPPELLPSSCEVAPCFPGTQPGEPYTTRQGRVVKSPDRLNL